MQEFKLKEEEQIIETVKCDYWENSFLFIYEKVNGEIIITNQRIIFMMTVLTKRYERVELNIENISTVEKCNVGSVLPLNPTGIKIGLNNGRKYKFSSIRNGKIIDIISSLINQKNS